MTMATIGASSGVTQASPKHFGIGLLFQYLRSQRLLVSQCIEVASGRIIEASHDEAEKGQYEASSDPTFVAIEAERRRYRGGCNGERSIS
jgi:hypothetical protein